MLEQHLKITQPGFDNPGHSQIRMLASYSLRGVQVYMLDLLDRLFRQLYVSRRGAYSIERLYALESYCSQTSKLRVFMVCLLFSLPPLLVPVMLEFIPLQHPSDGWRANHGCWLRVFLSGFCVTIAAIVQINAQIPELKLRFCAIVGAGFVATCIYTSAMIGQAALWRFPTPFSIVIGAIPWSCSTIFVLTLIVGVRRLRSNPKLRHRITQQIYVVCVQVSLVFAYSLFSAVYYWLPERHKMLFMLVLPVIKTIMQNAVAWAMKDLEEHQPGIVVFCVGVFNALYTSKCMQNSGSHMIYGLVAILDVLQGLSTLNRLRKTMNRLHAMGQLCDQSSGIGGQLLNDIVKISQEPGLVYHNTKTQSIRILAPIKPRLSHHNSLILDQLASDQLERVRSFAGQIGAGSTNKIMPAKNAKTHRDNEILRDCLLKIPQTSSPVSVQPLNVASDSPMQTNNLCATVSSLKATQNYKIMQLSLKLLFECEFRVLVEYVESIVPMMYAIFVAIMHNLSGAEYYPETRGKSTAQVDIMVLNITIYAGIEACSFLVMHFCVKWQTGLSLAYILAFVIENQTQELSGQIFIWYVFLLQFTLAHYGTCAWFDSVHVRITCSYHEVCLCRRCGFFAQV